MSCFSRRVRFVTALFLLLHFTGLNVTPALAGLAPSRVSGATTIASTRDADLLVVQRALEHKVVAQKLRDYGVEPEAAKTRLANLNDSELHQLASASAGLPSGGDGVGALISIAILILLIILIVKLLDKEIVVR